MKLKINNSFAKLFFNATLIIITVLSIIPTPFVEKATISGFTFRLDYLFHFIAYFLLAMFLMLWKKGKHTRKNFLIYILLFGIVSSFIFELIQIFLPNRVFNPMDVLFNLLGFVFCFLILSKKNILRMKRIQEWDIW